MPQQQCCLAFKIDEYLFIFECKATCAARGEQDKFLEWIDYFNEIIQILINKGKLLLYNLDNNFINIPFSKAVKKVITYQIQTEGVFSEFMVMTLQGFLQFLKVMHKTQIRMLIKMK